MMKKAWKMALFLAVVAAVSGLALSATNSLTAPIINANEVAKDREALEVVFPGAEFEKISSYSDSTGKISAIYKAGDQGYAYKMVVDGFGGKGSITFIVGFDQSGTITGYTVVSQGETKGIGSQVAEEAFVNSVIGKKSGDDVDAISGATISSTAVKEGLNIAAQHVQENYLGK